MRTGHAGLLRHLVRLGGPPDGAAPADGNLLDRFCQGRDEAAFRELLRRHAPLVLGVCRRVLGGAEDVEDAFQATFLVLAQKAGSLRGRASLASWLHGVAYRCAARLRAANARRRRHEGQAAAVPAVVAPPDLTWREVRQALDEELSRLPEKYRAPLVLCYLRGRTQCEAARELGWAPGVLRGRLDRGRERLRARLARRGLALAVGLLGAGLASDAAAAAPVAAALADSTLRAAALVASGRGAAGFVSPQVIALMRGASQAMLWSRITSLSAWLLVAAGVLGVGGVLAWPSGEGRPGGDAQAAAPAQPAPAAPGDRPPAANGEDKKDASSRPAAKTYTFAMTNKPWTEVCEWFADVTGLAYSGTYKPTWAFTFIPPTVNGKAKQYTIPEIVDILNEALADTPPKAVLIRRAQTFTLLPADEKIDATLLPRVSPDELEKRGKTELVTTVLPLTHVSAKELGPDVKKLLGPFGEVAVLEKANRLVLQDRAGNLCLIRELVKEVEAREAEKKRQSGGDR